MSSSTGGLPQPRVGAVLSIVPVLGRAVAVAMAVTGLLIPHNGISAVLYPLLFGIPLIISAAGPRTTRSFRLWAAYIIAFVLFVALRNIADDLRPFVEFTYVIRLERAFFLGIVPSEVLQRAFHDPGRIGAVELVAVGTYMSYFLIPPLVLVCSWAWHWQIFQRCIIASVIVFVGAVLAHLLVPTAPPWLAAEHGYISGNVEPILKTFFGIAAPPIHQYGAARMAENHVAAMPSVHMAVTWLVVLAAYHVGWRVGIVGLVYAVAMTITIVYLGDHYVVDALAGVALASMAWWGTGRFVSPADAERLV